LGYDGVIALCDDATGNYGLSQYYVMLSGSSAVDVRVDVAGVR